MNIEEAKCIVELGFRLRLCMSMKGAMEVLQVLSNENLLICETKYENKEGVEMMKPWGTEEVKICLISPAQYMVRCAAGEGK